MKKNDVIDMHVFPGVVMVSEITRLSDFSDPNNASKPANFLGLVLNKVVIHIPLDRGEKMKQLAEDVLAAWKSDADVQTTMTMIRQLFDKANLAMMIDVKNQGTADEFVQYRFYDAADREHTWKEGTASQSTRRRVDHSDYLVL